ncbi:helix-turn-helix transcriptional regulator [Actinoplanes sp. CA-051413]|uniref:helix-turn-helix transcriptional regulator n=1 Tax=Actinoplanes sp. CA-051413 TaxID=3239899 RepID=UPI003D9679E2
MNDRLLTPVEVAEVLGIPKSTLYAWRNRNVGPRAVRVGRHLRWRRLDVDMWIETRADPPGPSMK